MKLEPNKFHRILGIGPSGTGKTGSLAALVKAGYNIYLLDMENGSEILNNLLSKKDRSFIEIAYVADRFKVSKLGIVPVGAERAMYQAMKQLEDWHSQLTTDSKAILCIDSLSALGRAAFTWADIITKTPEIKDASGRTFRKLRDTRQIYKAAQDLMRPIVASLASRESAYHQIILTHTHIKETRDKEGRITSVEYLPKSIGPTLSRELYSYFNTVVEYKKTGPKYEISTQSNLLGLKTSSPMTVKKTYPTFTGLPTLLSDLTPKE